MQVEHVPRIGLASRRAAQQQRHLAIRPGLLGEVVVDDERVLAEVAEVFAHGAAGIGGDVLHRRRFGGRRRHHDGVLHGAVLLKLAHHAGHRRVFLPYRHVDALNAGALLVDDGVDGERGLAGLAIADDQLALTAADGHHGVDGLQARLHRLAHRLTGDHAGRHLLNRGRSLGLDLALAVDGLTERVHHSAQKTASYRHFQNAPGAADRVAFGDVLVVAEDNRADRILLEVERETEGILRELDHFALHDFGKTMDSGDAVGQRNDRAFRARLDAYLEILDLFLDQIADFCRGKLHDWTSVFVRPGERPYSFLIKLLPTGFLSLV